MKIQKELQKNPRTAKSTPSDQIRSLTLSIYHVKTPFLLYLLTCTNSTIKPHRYSSAQQKTCNQPINQSFKHQNPQST